MNFIVLLLFIKPTLADAFASDSLTQQHIRPHYSQNALLPTSHLDFNLLTFPCQMQSTSVSRLFFCLFSTFSL